MLAAYSIVFLSLLIVHIPFVISSGARSLMRAGEVFRTDLVSSHLGQLVLYGALITLLSYTEGLFADVEASSWYEHGLIAVKIALWATLVVGVGLRLCGIDVDAGALVTFTMVLAAGLTAVGTLSQSLPAGNGSRKKPSKNVLIVGTTTAAARVAKHLAGLQDRGPVVKGIISRYESSPRSAVATTGATTEELARIARAQFVDDVIVAGGEDRALAERAIAEAVRNHLDVSVVPDLFMEPPNRLRVQMIGGMPLISVYQEPMPWGGLLMKRVMDVVISAIGLLVLAPVMAVIGVAMKLESRGPILYTALRVGKKGRTFKCYKFRTMCRDADHAKDLLRALNQRQGPTFKMVNDPRITRLGRILRRYSLDELPQLWNVLTGSMSLVGPRPHPMDDYQRYALEDRRRLDVAPGITGLWQVTARGDPSFSANMALDLEYIENWSLGMDLAIVVKTLPAVLGGTGA
jgi:exopolysaccharide biosynthesis polyprenyl glycosylphosphotransferase